MTFKIEDMILVAMSGLSPGVMLGVLLMAILTSPYFPTQESCEANLHRTKQCVQVWVEDTK